MQILEITNQINATHPYIIESHIIHKYVSEVLKNSVFHEAVLFLEPLYEFQSQGINQKFLETGKGPMLERESGLYLSLMGSVDS